MSQRRFALYVALAAVALFAALGTYLCYDPGFGEFQALCERGKRRIAHKVPRFDGYVDATGTGCSDVCLRDLRSRTVRFVEMEFQHASYLAAKRRGFGVDDRIPVPQQDGLFKAQIRADEPRCAGFFGSDWSYDPALVGHCLSFEPVPRLTSRYEYRETLIKEPHSMGVLSGIFVEYRDRRTGEVIASRGAYSYEGTAARGLPLTYHQTCGDALLGLVDLMQ